MEINRKYTTTNVHNTGDRKRKGTRDDYHWIVVHYVGNADKNGFETTAKNNCIYYRDAVVGASANYYVDSTGVYQSVPWDSDRYAWHCGIGAGNEGKYQYLLNDGISQCNNSTAIGVEICVCKMSVKTKSAYDTDWYFHEKTYANAVAFVKYLMAYFHIGIDHVVRHYDVSTIHKPCPRPFVGNDVNSYYKKTGEVMWQEFKKKLTDSSINTITTPVKTETSVKTNTTVTTYRVRKSWADANSQIGAYSSLANAKNCVNKNPGYYVFDDNGTVVYPAITETAICQPYKTTAKTTLYSNYSTTSKNIASVSKAAYVLSSKQRSDGWLYVTYIYNNNVYKGWIQNKYTTKATGTIKTVSSPDGILNIRANSNSNGKLLATMNNGYKFIVLQKITSTNWGIIQCGETIGYCDVSDKYSRKG